ncbi:MAG: CDP-diacylglycerol--glycerol-3-phosphate 3-phosphatidyltransferase [Rhodospirillaceae bacterium]|jgi:cardiolipin synthase (CMP-forming)|nr:CDP-diacylglycerol--glycerol-3-phosphate 3-phosphatidyltransferase [Rhodospirillaceae bacterium]
MTANLPNILTASRIAAIPVLTALFFVEGDGARWAALVVFALAAATDYFDGHLARTRQWQSKLGQFLDPIADKLLIGALVFLLAAFDRIGGFAIVMALVILCREILISGLREYLAQFSVEVPVSTLAKWKTAIQMLAMGFLIVGDAAPWAQARLLGEIGLTAAAALTLITGYAYLRGAVGHMRGTGTGDGEEGEEETGGRPAARPS